MQFGYSTFEIGKVICNEPAGSQGDIITPACFDCEKFVRILITIMRESDWKTFLTEYNRELLSYEEVAEVLTPHLSAANM